MWPRLDKRLGSFKYDKAIRLTALVNENNATYSFGYDASDRLSE